MSKKTNLGLKQRMRDADVQERATIIDGLPYPVGFGKPPQSSRFKPGNSYGRRGRPKGAENLHTILAEEFDATVEVNERGRKRKLSKLRVALRQLANKIASGDIRALALYLELLRKTGQLAPQQKSEAPVFDARDLEAFQRLATIYGAEHDPEPPEDTPPATTVDTDRESEK